VKLNRRLFIKSGLGAGMCAITQANVSAAAPRTTTIAQLDKICDLAEKYDALVACDDSHCTGFLGKTGRGTHEYRNCMERVDIITSTLGKAMGGASGGFIAGPKEMIAMLRQRSRPYLFSNSLAPVVVRAAIQVVDMLSETTELRDKLEWNTKYFREQMTAIGYDIKPGDHPIVPIMLYNAKLSQDIARDLYFEGVYVIGFFYPVVAKGLARIRVQLSAGLDPFHGKSISTKMVFDGQGAARSKLQDELMVIALPGVGNFIQVKIGKQDSISSFLV